MENSDENNLDGFYPLPDIIEGILHKKVESKFTRLFKQMIPRFFTFDRVNRKFLYKKSEEDPKICKVYDKDQLVNYSPSVDKNEKLNKIFRYGFKLFTRTRIYTLFTNDKNDYDLWMRMFNFYFYGVDPLEEKEKVKSKIRKIQEKLHYPHHQFQLFKNISFTLTNKASKITEGKNIELEEITFNHQKNQEENKNEKENVNLNQEKVTLVDGNPLKENMDYNRKKVNLLKRYLSINNNNMEQSGTNNVNELKREKDVSPINLENVSNLNVNCEENGNPNQNVIQNNVLNIDFLLKDEKEDQQKIEQEINLKYKEFLEWPS